MNHRGDAGQLTVRGHRSPVSVPLLNVVDHGGSLLDDPVRLSDRLGCTGVIAQAKDSGA